MSFVDVHAHLTHERFRNDLPEVIERAEAAGLVAIVVNGLEPLSNRRVLELASRYPTVRAALGIYPIDAVHDRLPADFGRTVPAFDVDAEVAFIREQALAGRLAAVGECGLDGHWVDASTYARQEEVFTALIEVALDADLPLIVHSRRLEDRAAEILRHHGARRVDLHCFGGRAAQARELAEREDWYFSIPANARRSGAFQKMLRTLPEERILTETDAPYLAPTRGERCEPAHVVGTVRCLAELRGWSPEVARRRVWRNYRELFGPGG